MKVKMLFKNLLLVNCIAICFLFSLNNAYSFGNDAKKNKECKEECKEQNRKNAMQKMDMLKKMKLLEALDLEADNSDKFLAVYSSYEKQINGKIEQLQNLKRELNKEIKDNASVLKNKAESIISLQKEVNDLRFARLNELKKILSDKNFAKFILFEDGFGHEVNNALMKHKMSRGKEDGDHRKRDDIKMKKFNPKGDDPNFNENKK